MSERFQTDFQLVQKKLFSMRSTFAVRETASLGIMGEPRVPPFKALRVDCVLRALSSLIGLRGAPTVPPLCRETPSLGQHMLELGCENATVGKDGLSVKF